MKNAWLFDIDGVLTAPQSKKVSPEIINIVGKILENEPVAFVTGRSITWIKKNVFPELEKSLNVESLNRLFLSAEKGGVWEFFEQGVWKHFVKKELNPPEDFKQECKNLIEQQFGQYVFWDPKETMVSVEMNDGMTVEDFRKVQGEINEALRAIMNKFGLDGYEMDKGLIATDIQSKTAGKDLSAFSIVNFLKDKNLMPQKFLAFGDSSSDISMASHLYKEGFKVEFIFTGDEKLLGNKKYDFLVEVFDKQYEQGTLSYLQGVNRPCLIQCLYVYKNGRNCTLPLKFRFMFNDPGSLVVNYL